VVDEAAFVRRATRSSPQRLLQRRERAGEPDRHDRRRPGDCRQVDANQPGPPPRQQRANGHERDEREMEDDDQVGEHSVDHGGVLLDEELRKRFSRRPSAAA
jgi:hypothetical protein